MQSPVAHGNHDSAAAVSEAELIAERLHNAESVRILGLTDQTEIRRRFGEQFVLYRYDVGSRVLEGVIAPKKLMEPYLSEGNSRKWLSATF